MKPMTLKILVIVSFLGIGLNSEFSGAQSLIDKDDAAAQAETREIEQKCKMPDEYHVEACTERREYLEIMSGHQNLSQGMEQTNLGPAPGTKVNVTFPDGGKWIYLSIPRAPIMADGPRISSGQYTVVGYGPETKMVLVSEDVPQDDPQLSIFLDGKIYVFVSLDEINQQSQN